jgi:hypothetical protein
MDMSIQNTFRLIHKMFQDGHTEQAEKLCLIYLPAGANQIDDLLEEIARLDKIILKGNQ